MTTGHWNPGYRNLVTDFRRTKRSVFPGGLVSGQLCRDYQDLGADKNVLADIRKNAREVWAAPDNRPTSYRHHFKDKFSEVQEFAEARPLSPTRRNKPHPPLVFLNCRLHTVPGFFNPDATLGKDMYVVDDACNTNERLDRAALRSKYVGRAQTATAHLSRNRSPDPALEGINDPVERQGMEAWLKLASEPVANEMRNNLYSEKTDIEPLHRGASPQKASLHRYLKGAGVEERSHLDKASNRRQRPKTTDYASTHVTYGRQANYKDMIPRGDFSIHPEWTPKMQHHRLNGLSRPAYVPGCW